jgi:hypothetical protein
MLEEEYVFAIYEPWQRLLLAFGNLDSKEAKLIFREFLTVVPERSAWWLRTAALAEITWPTDSDEFIIAGWRLIKDGYADELDIGRSGGMWIALAFDWATHASEVLRTRYDLEWKLSTGKFNDKNYPTLVGFKHAHRTYGLSLHYDSQAYFDSVDNDPPYPIRILARTYEAATGIKRDLDHLAELGLPENSRSYIADQPPFENSASRSHRQFR